MSDENENGDEVESKQEAAAGGGAGTPPAKTPATPVDHSKAALVLAFQEVVNASAILAALITSDDSRGSTTRGQSFTGASCSK